MKHAVTIVTLALFLCAAYAAAETLTVLHLNDTHAHLLPYGPKDGFGIGMWGGMARVATVVGMNKMTEPNVILLHSGDLFVGDFMFQKYLSVPELEIMKQLGFDALTLGNHEFDLYPTTLKYVLDAAGFPGSGFPVLCANLDYTADPQMGFFVKPYVIKEYGAVKVGILGLTTDFANSGSNPQPLVIQPPLDVAQGWIDSLRIGHGCQVVILLSHLGAPMDQAVAASTSGIDVIVGGHTHTQLDQPITIGNTLVLQAGEFAHYLGKLHLTVESGAVVGYDYQLIPVNETVPAEPAVSGLLAMLAAGVEADPRFGPVYTTPVAHAAIDLDKQFAPGLVMDNPMGNMISDAFRQNSGTDISFQPQGFINQPIWAGPVMGNDVFQAVPYGFDESSGLGLKLATFETDGMSIIAGLEFAVYNLPYLEDFFLQASNFSYSYNSSSAPGSRVDYGSIAVGGTPLNPFGTYTVTVPDGVVPFLMQIPGFNVSNLTITGQFMYTVVKEFMSAHSPVSYYRQGRVLDLAALSDPVAGAVAMGEMVAMYAQNGSISKTLVATKLQRDFAAVAKQLREDRTIAALARLYGIKVYIRAQLKLGTIDPEAGRILLYARLKLVQSVMTGSGFALKGTEEDQFGGSIPGEFALSQNYPNPFNPTTTIGFTLPTAAHVSLDVYNMLGQRVRSLIDAEMEAGAHQVDWNSTDQNGHPVSSGVYFYRLVAGANVASRKMVLLK